MMEAYLINLDARADRLAFMQAQLGPMGLAYRRITAVNGLGETDIGYPASHPRLTKGEFACYLSHMKCWQALIESGDARCLILEDDVAFAPDFKACLAHQRFFDHASCVTRLECSPFPTVLAFSGYRFNGTRLCRQISFDGGTGAYVITREYAAYLLAHHSVPKIPVDDLVLNSGETNYKPHMVFRLDPAPATQRLFLPPNSPLYDHESDLQAERQLPGKPVKSRGTWQAVKRFFKTRLENARRKLLYTTKIVRFSGSK